MTQLRLDHHTIPASLTDGSGEIRLEHRAPLYDDTSKHLGELPTHAVGPRGSPPRPPNALGIARPTVGLFAFSE